MHKDKYTVTRPSTSVLWFSEHIANLPETDSVRIAFYKLEDARLTRGIIHTKSVSADGLVLNGIIDYGSSAVFDQFILDFADDFSDLIKERNRYDFQSGTIREYEAHK